MTNAVYAYNAEIIPAHEFQPGLFDSFLKYIDRGEQTTRTYTTNLKQFFAWLQYAAIRNPEREDILSYRDYLVSEHKAIRLAPGTAAGWEYQTDAAGNRIVIKCKPNTAAQYLRSVCQFFKWAAANGYYRNIAENIHAPKIRHDAHKKEALRQDSVLAIEENIVSASQNRVTAARLSDKDASGKTIRATEQGKRLLAMYLLAVNCGLRTIELSRANIKDLETINGTSILYVWGKGHSEPDAKKILAPEVRAAIDDYLNARTDRKTGSSPLFVSTGNRSGGKRIAATTISKMLKAAMRSAGFDSDRLTAHSLRHTAGTNVMQLTGNLYETQQYMRHANPATTEIYLHVDTERQEADIAQRLYNRYHGISGEQDQRQHLESLLQRMSPEQLEQMAGIAAAMTR